MVKLTGTLLGPKEERGRRIVAAGIPEGPLPGEPFRREGVVSVGSRDITSGRERGRLDYGGDTRGLLGEGRDCVSKSVERKWCV